MTEYRLRDLLTVFDRGGTIPSDMTQEEQRYFRDQGLVESLDIPQSAVYDVVPNQTNAPTEWSILRTSPKLTPKGKRCLSQLEMRRQDSH